MTAIIIFNFVPMKTILPAITCFVCFIVISPVHAQKRELRSIERADLETHMKFLASDELQGRATGEPGLDIAARYLAVQAARIGLQPADGDRDYLQYYSILEGEIDWNGSAVTIREQGRDPVVSQDHFFVLPSAGHDSLVIEGEIVFAGYGIMDEKNGYNDLEGIDIRDKVVLIMNRGPMNETGDEALFDNEKWNSMQCLQYKMQALYSRQPKAVLQVFDPKSGIRSIEDINPRIADYLGKSRGLKMEDTGLQAQEDRPKMILIHRNLADLILEGTGRDLARLQQEIDRNMTPRSFHLEGKQIRIAMRTREREMMVPNVFGMIEGSDPQRRDEVVIYTAHFDHVGTDNSGAVFNGADDNASGTVALIEIAEAFMKEKKHPPRGIGFLWVSGEEIGLFGSEYFAANPLVPAENIAAVINLDMVGRTKTRKDAESGRDLTIVGGDSVKVIGALQSRVLMEINEQTLREMGMQGNYTYNDRNHPERYFYRSDHINFARKDIPVLFYSTGTHTDYHQVTDDEERIDYDKFLKMTRLAFKVGFNVARYRDPIAVDNPFSLW